MLKVPRGWGALALLMAAFGCNDGGELSDVAPSIRLNPSQGPIVFEEVVLGRTRAGPQTIDIINTGSSTLELREVTIRGEGASAFEISTFADFVQPNDSEPMILRFKPNEPGTFQATLQIESNDLDNSPSTLPLQGPARDPCVLSVEPQHQQFLLGEIRKVTVTTASTYKCVITSLGLDRRIFEILNDPELPLTIEPGDRLELEIQNVATSAERGAPTRALVVREEEGTEVEVTLSGEPPVFGCLSVFPSQLNFRREDFGVPIQDRIRVTNSCFREASITSVRISTGYRFYSVVDQDQYPVTVQPGQTKEVWIEYRPFSSEGDHGRVAINTNDAANPRFNINLEGSAKAPVVQSFPSELDFGTVVYRNPTGTLPRSECASRSKFMQVYSVGDGMVRVNGLRIEQDAGEPFQITAVTVDGEPVTDYTQPFTIPGTVTEAVEMRVTIRFLPTAIGPHEARLVVEHVATNADTTEVSLKGIGAPEGDVRDVFRQAEGPKVDILWVIDDSCSMLDEQLKVINNLSQFIGYADTLNSEYQIAVTNTDSRSPDAGKFERPWPHPAIMYSEYPETPGLPEERRQEIREEAFGQMFDVGTQGSGIEAGLGAAMRALERAQIDDPENINYGFLRDDANLAIIVISDERDQSQEGFQVLHDFFLSIKGQDRPDRMAVHVIVSPQDDSINRFCQDIGSQADPAPIYWSMAEVTGGRIQDICAPDWQPTLQSLGLDVFVPLNEWSLTQSADPASVQVELDGVPVPQDGTNGYTFDPGANSVEMNGTWVPNPGAEVSVEYTSLCRP